MTGRRSAGQQNTGRQGAGRQGAGRQDTAARMPRARGPARDSSPTLTLRAGPLSARIHVRSLVVLGTIAALVLGTLVGALTLGVGGFPFASLLYGLGPGADDASRLVFEWRASRALAAVLFGACLGVSGAIFQSLTRNTLGSPDIIGLTAGSYAGVVGVIMLGGTGFAATAAGSMLGGLIAAAAVYLLAFQRGVTGFRLIIVGIGVGAMLTSITSWFGVKAELDEALRAAIWGAGTLSGMRWGPLASVAIAAAAVLLAAAFVARALPQFALGDDVAASLGMRVEWTKLALVLVGVTLTAIVTAVAGPIAFIALAAPQLARRLTGSGQGIGLVGSALVGALLLAVADLVAQYLVPGLRLPVGAVTVVIGGAYLVWLLLRENARR